MKTLKIPICLFTIICLTTSVQAQGNCEEAYSVLNQTETLVQFSSANGPAAFRRQVENSSISQELRSCENFQSIAWENIMSATNPGASGSGNSETHEKKQFFLIRFFRSIFKSKRKQKVSYETELKTAFLITTYGYTSQVNIEKVKDFVRSKPWERGLTYSSHLAVDILLMHNNDAKRDPDYQTYTLDEMKRARDLYAKQ